MREREAAQARRSASPNSDEEEKTSPERQQTVRMVSFGATALNQPRGARSYRQPTPPPQRARAAIVEATPAVRGHRVSVCNSVSSTPLTHSPFSLPSPSVSVLCSFSQRGRYSKEHMAELGQVFSSSELGRDREWGLESTFGFDPERADALSGSHFHRPQGVSLAALRPVGYEPVTAGGRASSASAAASAAAAAMPTFATEEDASPRSNLGIGSFGPAKPSSAFASASFSSGGGGQNAHVAETTGKTIWQMWQRMKQDRVRALQREMEREAAPASSASRQQQQQPSASSAAAAAASSSLSSIDYVEAGKHIAAQLSRAGVAVSHNHLDVIHNLAGLEKVWLQASEGLDEGEFVAFLREVLRLPAEELSILFQKMDANADGSLSWDEYLSYLLIEVTHHWQFRSARGTWHLRDVDAPATACHAQVQQILVLPRDTSSPAAAASLAGQPKYVLSCRDNSIQVWNAASMTYQCHLPPAWTKSGGPPDSRGAIMGLGGGVTSSGYGVSSSARDGGSGAGGSDEHRPQTYRIGERRAGAGLRQKRCGGGGWKEDASSATTGRHAAAGANGAPGSIEESIQRRAMHAGLARLSLANKDGSSSARNRFGLGGAGGAAEGLDEWGSPLANPNAGDDDDSHSHGRGGGVDGELGSNPFSRPRQSQGVLHTTVVYYPNQKQLLVASMDKSIHVYQQAFRQFVQVDRSEVRETPQCMTVHSQVTAPSSFQQSNAHTSSLTNDLLIVGDTAGKCSAYHLPFSRDLVLAGMEKVANGGGSSISGGLIGDRPGFATGIGGVGTPGGQVSMPSLVAPFGSGGSSGLMGSAAAAAFNSRFAWSFQVHAPGETVRKVAVIPTVGLVSAGMDAKLHISDLSTRQVVRSLLGHKRGVYAFAHCESHRCIFSAGFDSKVLVFDPYLPHPTGSLAGHHGSILDVVVNSRRNQIITTCADKKIKVFDIRTMKMIQSLADNQEYAPYDQLSAVAFDQEQQQLVTAGNKLRLWPVIIAPGNKARRGGPAHSNLVVAICFSKVFQQIVSISVDESVHLWDIYTGRSVFEFRTNHGSPLTAACLDHRGKRLLTGAHDGTVSMWNFHNGAKMSEFTSRGKELIQLLYLPRTLQCVVGIGWERHVVRWPDPNAPKNTKWLVQSDHKAEVSCVAFFQSILVTAASDGEIIVWYMDSALVSKRFYIPLTPGKAKRPGVTKMTFVDFPSGFVVLLAGTDDGSLHFIKLPGSAETIYSLFELFPEPIQGLAVNRRKEDGARTRLMVVDCQVDAKLFDLSGIRGTASSNTVGPGPSENDEIRSLPLLKQWEPHPLATSTDLIAIDDIDCFASASDTGDITLWSLEGEQRCKFAQRKSWPIADPRTASHRETNEHDAERKKGGAGAGATTQPDRSSGASSSSDEDDDDDDEDSDASQNGARSSEWGSGDEVGGRPGLSRKQSQLSNASSRSGTSSRGGGLKKKPSGGSGGGSKKSRRRRDRASSPSAHRKPEPSFAESHPKFIPRDETSKYLKEHAQQVAMDAAAARAAKEAAAAESAAAAAAAQAGRKHGGKLPLAEMLNKLETDLKHAHAHSAHSHANSHSQQQHASDSASLSFSGSSGAHVYDRFHAHPAHHSSGSQHHAGSGSGQPSIHFVPTAAPGSASLSANFDPLADLSPTPAGGFAYPYPSNSGGGSVTSRGPRRHDDTTTNSGAAGGSSAGASTARLPRPRPAVSFNPDPTPSSPPAVRVGLSQGSRTISNSDVFTQPSPAMSRLRSKPH